MPFVALVASKAHAEYVLGPGDKVKIEVLGYDEIKIKDQIPESNAIQVPLIGKVTIGGLTEGGAEKLITELLATKGIIKDAQVQVSVTEYISKSVAVMGFVRRPGKYPIKGRETVLDLIALAGGVSPDGDERVVIVRTDNSKHEVDLRSLFRGSKNSDNIFMVSGDIVYIPRAPIFYVFGDVRHPGSYRLRPGMTVMQAISVAGGLLSSGRKIEISRDGRRGEVTTVPAELEDRLRPDDVLQVSDSFLTIPQ